MTTTEAIGNAISGRNDYRLLLPDQVTDPNQNVSSTAFDILGRVAATATSGKAGEGDLLTGFTADLSDPDIAALRANPFANPGALLGNATIRYVYDPFAYFRTRNLATPDSPMV